MAPQRGLLGSLLILVPIFGLVLLYALREHYALPDPILTPTHPVTGAPHVSEAGVLAAAKYLSEDIGYRIVGTAEHAAGDAWVLEQAEELVKQCQQVVAESTDRKLECEVWHQRGSGKHRFDMMGKRLYKTYVDLSNIVVRVSNGTPEGKEHAVLVNSHVDSTLPSPGAADDAISVGVMLECLRVFIQTKDWSPRHAIVFLFNDAEESLQDGSHLYSTQHVTAPSVRAAINLEAAGTTGRELLFQATSEQMIEAYSKVPRPMGTIVAADIFNTGIMLSDTDFRQFVEYLDVTGLDMAIVGNSYLYHMRKDIVENIQPGTAQHMAENSYALLHYLSSDASPLPSLAAGYSRPSTVYFSYLSSFYMYSARTALVAYAALTLVSLAYVRITFVEVQSAVRHKRGVFGELANGAKAVFVGVFGALAGTNVVAVVMERVLGRGMSWFAHEFSCLALYGPAALTGALVSQLLIAPVRERTLLEALLVLQSAFALAGQAAGIGSAATLALNAAPLLIALLIDGVLALNNGSPSLLVYALGQVTPLLTGAVLVSIVLDVFVPLTGRIGADAPSEHIIATIVALVTSYTFPLTLPLLHRTGRRTLARAALVSAGATILAIAVFAQRSPFDAMHQRRLLVLHMENTTSMEQHLHLAALDRAPGFDELVHDIADEFGAVGVRPEAIVMNDWNPDWDVIYPVSAFITPRKVDLKVDDVSAAALVSGDRIVIKAVNDRVNPAEGTRSLTLRIEHPNIIWTSIAFDAHVLKWSLDDNPPAEYARHHVKEASFHGVDAWSVDLVVKLPKGLDGKPPPKLRVDHVGIRETAMWPGKRREKLKGGRAMEVFEIVDGWLQEKTEGKVDAMMVGCVGGVTFV